tara:strand:- start:742 stop:936 length:195 start_codon:yes stop_codon:yes gene_type:complete
MDKEKKMNPNDLKQSKEDSSINIWEFLTKKNKVKSNCPIQGILVNPKALFSLFLIISAYFFYRF